MVKIIDREIYWLEQSQWQHLTIPDNHPHFQTYLAKTIEELIGAPLSLKFPNLSPANSLAFFTPKSSSSKSRPIGEHKEPQLK